MTKKHLVSFQRLCCGKNRLTPYYRTACAICFFHSQKADTALRLVLYLQLLTTMPTWQLFPPPSAAPRFATLPPPWLHLLNLIFQNRENRKAQLCGVLNCSAKCIVYNWRSNSRHVQYPYSTAMKAQRLKVNRVSKHNGFQLFGKDPSIITILHLWAVTASFSASLPPRSSKASLLNQALLHILLHTAH